MNIYCRACFAFVAAPLLFSAGCGTTAPSSSTALLMKWKDLPQELQQGKIVLHVQLKNVQKENIKMSEWIADGWGANFGVLICKPEKRSDCKNLPVATPRGFIKYESMTLKAGESCDLTGEFNLNVEPGEYEVVAVLKSSPSVLTTPANFHVTRGQIFDTKK